MGQGKTSLRAVLLSLVILLDVGGHLGGWPGVLNLVSLLNVAAFLVCFPTIKRPVQVTALVLTALGAGLILAQGASLQQWLEGLRNLTGIFVLVALVRLLVIPWQVGGYREEVARYFTAWRHVPARLYALATVFAFLISSILLVGSVPVTSSMLKDVAGDYLPDRFITRATSAGFVTALFWTPLAPLQALGLKAAGVEWSRVALLGLLMALGGVALNILLVQQEVRRRPEPAPAGDFLLSAGKDQQIDAGPPWRTLAHFGVLLPLLGVAIILGEHLLPLSTFYLIALLVTLAALIWCLVLRQGRIFGVKFMDYAREGMVTNATEFGLLLGAGLVAFALDLWGVGRVMEPLWAALREGGWGNLVYPLITLAIWLSSFSGVHPLALIAIMAGVLQTSMPSLNLSAVFLALVAGGAFSYLTSPFSISIIVLSGIVGRTTLEVGLGWNGRFALAFFLLVTLVMLMIG